MPNLVSIIDTSNKVPRAYVKVSLGVGPRSPGAGPMKVLVVGSALASGGTGVVGTRYPIITADDAVTLFGAKSELSVCARLMLKANPTMELYMAQLDDSSGGTAASKTIAFTGTATADGTLEVWIKGQRIVVGVTNGMTATQLGDALVLAIGGNKDVPATGVNTTGSVAVSSTNKGARFNWISTRSKLTGATGITHTPVTGYMTSGTDTGADPLVILDDFESERFHLLVCPYTDSTNMGKFKSYCAQQINPVIGKRCRWIGSSFVSLATDITTADSVNDQLGQILSIRNPDNLPIEVAGVRAAMIVAVRGSDRAYNTDDQLLPGILPQFSQGDVFIDSELVSALNHGLTPLISRNGEVHVVRDITSYHLDALSNLDYSVLDTHYVDVAIFMADAIEQNFSTQYAGFKLAPDNTDGEPLAPKVATPLMVTDYLFKLAKQQENKLLVNVDALKAALVVQLDNATPGRCNAEFPIDVIELFHQLAVDLAQVG